MFLLRWKKALFSGIELIRINMLALLSALFPCKLYAFGFYSLKYSLNKIDTGHFYVRALRGVARIQKKYLKTSRKF